MKIKSIKIHNFRSILDSGEISLDKLSLLIGANNVGKSNVISALRILYDLEKFESKRDFPKPALNPQDNESWMDVTYKLTPEEHGNLPDYAKVFPEMLKIRKYFKSSEPDRVKAGQSNIYAYEKENIISLNLFHGAKNVSEAKLGRIIFIPSVNKTEDILKTSGPSPLRQIVTFVFEKVAKKSTAFTTLESAFETFNSDFSVESSADGYSLQNLIDDIDRNLKEWGVAFGITIERLRIEDIVRNLFTTNFKDEQLAGEPIEINQYGQGFQRHIIYTLIKLSAQYVDKKEPKKKEFSPNFTLILFEEPEAFLHPAQQEVLSASLSSLVKNEEEEVQILLSTHSPLFVSRRIEDLSSLIRLCKENGITSFSQISDVEEDTLFGDNTELGNFLNTKLSDASVEEKAKKEIRGLNDGSDDLLRLEQESMRYFLWLDSERCALFFADFVVVCEGPSEKLFIEYLIKNEWEDLQKKRVYFLDASGKYNVHRFMNLLGLLKIPHSVIIDSDNDRAHHKLVNEFIEKSKNKFTKKVEKFNPDFEEFLGIKKPTSNRPDKKPLNIFWHFKNSKISKSKITELKKIVESVIK